jgi:hypothetical protein
VLGSGGAAGVVFWYLSLGGGVPTCPPRRCTAAGARRHLATTPAGWAEFARRSAVLAARLAG